MSGRTPQPEPPQRSDRALLVGRCIAVLLTLALLALAGRVVQLQVEPDERIARLIDSQASTRRIPGRRGTITDRRGKPLATTRVDYRLFLDPAIAADPDRFAAQVAFALGYSPMAVQRQIEESPAPRYVVIDERVRPERVETVRSQQLTGVGVEPMLVREYPHGPLAGQLLGFVSVDGQGLEGVERWHDETLAAEAGRMRYLRDASRRALMVAADDYAPQRDGGTLRLSIDATLQHLCETQLIRAVERFGAESAQCVLMDPYTGEILAMANVPTFDPRAFGDAEPDDWRNRCVTDVFEPGSIFKPFVWAGLTEMGVVTPDEVFDTESGAWSTGFGRLLRDSYPYDELSWQFVLVKSSNIGMGKAAMRITHDQLREIVTRFGFGQPTGSGLPGEIGGLVTSARNWSSYSQTSVPMGQEIALTPLQLVRAFAAIANGGELITPTIHALDPDNPTPGLIRQRILTPDAVAQTIEALRLVMSPQGTGRHAIKVAPHYSLFGKTGTAQLPAPDGGYYDDRFYATFVAGAPVDTPRLVIGVFIKDPDDSLGLGHGGGAVAAPVACMILEEALLYLDVEPDLVPFEAPPDWFVLTGPGDGEPPAPQ